MRIRVALIAMLVGMAAAVSGCVPILPFQQPPSFPPKTSAARPPGDSAPSDPSSDAPTSACSFNGDLTGTTWVGTDSDGETLTLWFNANGRLKYENTGGGTDVTPDNDTWSVVGDKLTMRMNDGYAVYEGTISGTTITGTAKNVADKEWTWEVELDQENCNA